ncbi:simple sugar transport system permease protein [Peptoniphilus ivorii]|uniref:ABC transporter permease subunit n=1 Tax=Aedoeadaptatus ivorii TaxID=54006 RepID=UPI0027818172|nr:ABC transporter permease [Peptoniphilus ivorii]MDQ0508181.1 simple sugar transport system permease protein [Peptoniphilus ivorii]
MNKSLQAKLSRYMVPILFIVIIVIGLWIAKPPLAYVTSEISKRMIRNTFLVLSLIVPIIAGMGINFGIPLGAMAGQIGLVFAQDWGITGPAGILVAVLIGTPIAIVLGQFSGRVLNRARGREMITSMMLAFFMLGVYMLFLLYMCGTVIPMHNASMLLSKGYGVKNSITLDTAQAIDNILLYRIYLPLNAKHAISFDIPVVTILVIALMCLFIVWFKKTKLGHDMRAVGMDQVISANAGIYSDKIRIQSIVISTVLACYGQIIYLQNIGTLATYAGQDQAALYAAASILVGGASVMRATIPNAVIGTMLFHLMFIVLPQAGRILTGDAMMGEYFRTFISYGVVTLALIMHAYNRAKQAEEARKDKKEAAPPGSEASAP